MISKDKDKYIMNTAIMEHYRLRGIEDANEYEDTVELSNRIAREFEHYADRWNPAKMEYVNAMIGVLVVLLRKQMNYAEDLWINPSQETYTKRWEKSMEEQK